MNIATDDILLLINEVLASKRTNLFDFDPLTTIEPNESIPPVQVKIDSETDLETAGIDSFGFIQLIVLIEEKYEVEIPDENLLFSELNTISKIQQLLENLLM